MEANHHIQHPSVLQRTSGVIFVADQDIIPIHVCPDVGFVVIINLIMHIQIFQRDVCGSFMFLFCLVFAMSLCLSVYMCFVVTCWERADLLALVCGVYCECVTFPLVSWIRCGT